MQLSLVPWAICLVAFLAWWTNPLHHIHILGTIIGSALSPIPAGGSPWW